MKSTPIPSLLAEAAEPPLYLRRKFLANKYVLKLFSLKKEFLISKLFKIAMQNLNGDKYWTNRSTPLLSESFCDLSDTRIYCLSSSIFDFPLSSLLIRPQILPKLNYSDIAMYNDVLIKEVMEKYNYTNCIYTDGSKSVNGVGAAFYDPVNSFEGSLSLHSSCSVFTAEVIAIVEALLYIKSKNFTNCVICSDSLSTITLLKNLNYKSKIENQYIFKILQLIEEINSRNYRVAFLWVKAHIGIQNNHHVDHLAGIAITSPNIQRDYHVPYSDIFSILKYKMLKEWQSDFNIHSQSIGKNFAFIHGNVKFKTWFSKINRPRRFITTLSRLKFGHCSCPSHLFKIKIVASPLCSCNLNQVADVNHILFNCNNNFSNISKFISKLVELNIYPPNSFSTLYNQVSLEVIDTIIHFLDSSKLKL